MFHIKQGPSSGCFWRGLLLFPGEATTAFSDLLCRCAAELTTTMADTDFTSLLDDMDYLDDPSATPLSEGSGGHTSYLSSHASLDGGASPLSGLSVDDDATGLFSLGLDDMIPEAPSLVAQEKMNASKLQDEAALATARAMVAAAAAEAESSRACASAQSAESESACPSAAADDDMDAAGDGVDGDVAPSAVVDAALEARAAEAKARRAHRTAIRAEARAKFAARVAASRAARAAAGLRGKNSSRPRSATKSKRSHERSDASSTTGSSHSGGTSRDSMAGSGTSSGEASEADAGGVEEDEVARKRRKREERLAKNRAAANASRQRKKEAEANMHAEIATLRALTVEQRQQLDDLTQANAALRMENDALRAHVSPQALAEVQAKLGGALSARTASRNPFAKKVAASRGTPAGFEIKAKAAVGVALAAVVFAFVVGVDTGPLANLSDGSVGFDGVDFANDNAFVGGESRSALASVMGSGGAAASAGRSGRVLLDDSGDSLSPVAGAAGDVNHVLVSAMDRAARRSPVPQLWSPSAGLTFALYALGARRVAEVLLLNAVVLSVGVALWAAWKRLRAPNAPSCPANGEVSVPVNGGDSAGSKASSLLPPSGVVSRPVVAGVWRTLTASTADE